MIPATLLGRIDPKLNNDRRTAELQQYLRAEWKMGIPALLAEMDRKPARSRLRIRRWWRRSRVPERTSSASSADGGDLRGLAPKPTVPVASCDHPTADHLGLGGTAQYLRCVLCGAVLVAVRGRGFAVAPEPEIASDCGC